MEAEKSTTTAKAKRKRREPRGWYIAKGVRMPLEEFLKDKPKNTGPSRWEELRKMDPDFFGGEILDMRAVLK
jgi:hypothetical protein